MYCKKCGHRQENGEKFCPVCGEPFLDPNGKPYVRGVKKDLLDVQKKVSDKASDVAGKGKATAGVIGKSLSEAVQKGKQQFEQKVQPQLSDGIDQLKNTDWEGKKKKASSRMKAFLNNPKQTRKWSIIIAVMVTLLFLVFKAGFSASWFWLALLAFMLVMPFLKQKNADEHRLQELGKGTFILTVVLGLFVLFFGPSDGASSWSGHEYSSPSEGGESSGGSAYEGQIADLQNQIKSKSEEVENLAAAYRQALAQTDGNVMVAQRMYPDICSKFRDGVNEYSSLCHKAADICAKNGDQSQATYFRQLAAQMDRSVAEMEGRP